MNLTVDLPWQAWPTMAAIVAIVVLYATEKWSIEVISIGAVAYFLVFFHLFPVETGDGGNALSPTVLLSGFSSTALFSVMALLVIGQGVFQTGALEGPTQTLLRMFDKRRWSTFALMIGAAFFVSAFLNNTPVVVIAIPIVAAVAAKLDAEPSSMMMPLSFISILAGQTTLIGSSTNLLAAGVLRQSTGESLGFFAPTPIGLMLAGVGLAYILFVMPRLLPKRRGADTEDAGDGKQFIVQLELGPGHKLAGAQAVSGLFKELAGVTVRLVQRGERVHLPPFEKVTLAEGDVLVFAATRKRLTDLLKSRPDFMTGVIGASDADALEELEHIRSLNLAEAVIAPGSRMVGRTIGQIGFRYQTKCILLGVQRRSRMIRGQMNDIRLEAGDVLLILGAAQDIRALRMNRDVLLLDWSRTELPDRRHAHRALLIFGAVAGVAAMGLLPIVVASFLGALAMVAGGCLNMRQAVRAFDERIFFLVGAAIAMGAALDATGGARFLAGALLGALDGFAPAVVLSAFFLLAAITTNLLSNNATAVLFTPIGVETATQLDIAPMTFVLAAIYAANCSFATPIGYKTNLLVMGPGHYNYGDFVRAGAPLVVLLWIAFSILAPWWWDL